MVMMARILLLVLLLWMEVVGDGVGPIVVFDGIVAVVVVVTGFCMRDTFTVTEAIRSFDQIQLWGYIQPTKITGYGKMNIRKQDSA